MSISTTWVNFLNGATGAAIRAALNTFNTNILSDMVATEGRVGIVEPKVTTNISDIAALDVRVTGAEGDIVDLENPTDISFVPQVTAPSHQEGQIFYDANEGTFRAQGPIVGVDVAVGHGLHTHVFNNTGLPIEKGMAVRHDGVAAGVPQVTKAIATSFDNARVWGVVVEEIPNGAIGAIQTFGEIIGLSTTGLPTGVPLYLSDTVAGTYTAVTPDIVSRIGGSLLEDALDGRIFIDIINNKSLPAVLGVMQGQTPGNETYSLTTTVQDIINYASEESVVMDVDLLTGIITIPNKGDYRMNFTSSLHFVSSTSTRSVTFEFYDITGTVILYSFVKNIPRDAIEDSASFSFPFNELLSNQYKMRVKASTAMDITFTGLSFDIESVNII